MTGTDIVAVALANPCPYCQSGTGEWCYSVSDQPARYLHSQRINIVHDAAERDTA